MVKVFGARTAPHLHPWLHCCIRIQKLWQTLLLLIRDIAGCCREVKEVSALEILCGMMSEKNREDERTFEGRGWGTMSSWYDWKNCIRIVASLCARARNRDCAYNCKTIYCGESTGNDEWMFWWLAMWMVLIIYQKLPHCQQLRSNEINITSHASHFQPSHCFLPRNWPDGTFRSNAYPYTRWSNPHSWRSYQLHKQGFLGTNLGQLQASCQDSLSCQYRAIHCAGGLPVPRKIIDSPQGVCKGSGILLQNGSSVDGTKHYIRTALEEL